MLEALRPIIPLKPHTCLFIGGGGAITTSMDQQLRPFDSQSAVPRAETWGFYHLGMTYRGSTELGGLDFAGEATLGSGPKFPEDPSRVSGPGPGGLTSTSLVEARRCSLSFTSFSRDLALCSARRRSNCFFRPGTALRWLSECV